MSIQNKSFQGSLCCKVKKKQNDKDRPKDPSGCLKTSGGSALIVAETISLCLNSWFCEMLKILGCFSFEVYITSNTTYIVYDKLLLAYKKVNWSQSTFFLCVCLFFFKECCDETDLRNWTGSAASSVLCRCRGSCGCSSCCRWSSPPRILHAELF